MDTHPPVPAELPSLLPVSASKRSGKTPFVVLLFALVQALSMNWFFTASSVTNAEVKISQAREYCGLLGDVRRLRNREMRTHTGCVAYRTIDGKGVRRH